MPDVRNQIRTYLDQTSKPITPDEVYDQPVGEGKVRPLTRFPVRTRISTGVLVAAAAAAVALLILGIPLLVNPTVDSAPAENTEPSTTFATTTTVVVQSAPTTIQQVTVDVVSSIVPGLGTLTWERIDGDETTLPSSISNFVDGQYIAYDQGMVWTSADAVTWAAGESSTFGDYSWFHEEGGWAIGSSGEFGELLRKDADSWVRVQFPESQLPVVPGITWDQHPRMPLESDGVILADMTAWGQVAWGDVFGTFEVDCGEPEPCEMQPFGMWDAYAEVVRIENPENGAVLAQAEIVVAGDDVRFVDQKSGDVIHTIVGGPGLSADEIVLQVKRDGGFLQYAGAFVSLDDGASWSWVALPWQREATIVESPDGGFAAFVFDYRWQENPEQPLVATEVWTSRDGMVWTDHGDLGIDVEGVQHVAIRGGDNEIIASAITGHDGQTGLEESTTYVSTNALDWQVVDLPFPVWFGEQETNFGAVISSMPQNRHMFWVSTDDGAVWHEVEGPPGSHEPSGAGGGYGGGGATGDILFVAFGSDEGPRTLWIGRFVP